MSSHTVKIDADDTIKPQTPHLYPPHSKNQSRKKPNLRLSVLPVTQQETHHQYSAQSKSASALTSRSQRSQARSCVSNIKTIHRSIQILQFIFRLALLIILLIIVYNIFQFKNKMQGEVDNLKATVASVPGKVIELLRTVGTAAGQAAATVAEKTKDVAGDVADGAKGAAGAAGDAIKGLAANVF
ncbi:hypothetical protein HK102_000625 [Quaeritorhiza haematococci]|nr:hypothetical protein HK102_000625 [Quaeritorhiza haematococci]